MTNKDMIGYALACIAVFRECRDEPDEGQIAVACCIRERVIGGWQGSSWWGRTYYEVVTKEAQFSSMTYDTDNQLDLFPKENDSRWERILEIVEQVISGKLPHPFPTATHYYGKYLDPIGKSPKWAERANYLGTIGKHKFYHLES